MAAWLSPGSLWLAVMPLYGWLILSFMAGSLWGFADRLSVLRAAAVVFPLLAVPAYLFLPPVWGLALMAVLFLTLLPIDAALLRQQWISRAYWRLRLAVTAAVVACLLLVIGKFGQ